jgi:rhodanese-related sulfurtransferase
MPHGAAARAAARPRGILDGVPGLERLPRRDNPQRVPRPAGEPGLVVVDATWGTIRPMELAPGVRTVGELEVRAHIEAGRRIVDTRQPDAHAEGTIPTARGIRHEDVLEQLGDLDSAEPVVLFCNGPQCAATPDAVHLLLEAGRPPEAILYYRGGLHDWVTLGLPVERPA